MSVDNSAVHESIKLALDAADAATDVTTEYNRVKRDHRNLEASVKQIHRYTTIIFSVSIGTAILAILLTSLLYFRSLSDLSVMTTTSKEALVVFAENVENVNNRNINEKIDKIKVPKQTASNSSEHKILNFMENNWEQKFSSIIKESLKNDINKIELDVKPKNLGKVRLEVKVDKDVTKIDFTAENIETANLLNENINKITDFLNEGN